MRSLCIQSVSIISELCVVLCLSVCCWDCLSKDLLIFYLPCLEEICSGLPFTLGPWLELLGVRFLFASRLLWKCNILSPNKGICWRDQFVWSVLQSVNNIGASCFVSSRSLSEGFVGSESVPGTCAGVRLPDTDLDCRKASTLSQHCLPQLDLWVLSSWPALLSLCLSCNVVGRKTTDELRNVMVAISCFLFPSLFVFLLGTCHCLWPSSQMPLRS